MTREPFGAVPTLDDVPVVRFDEVPGQPCQAFWRAVHAHPAATARGPTLLQQLRPLT